MRPCSTPGGWERDRAARLGTGNETVQHAWGLGTRPCSTSGGWERDRAARLGAGNETVQHVWGLGTRPCSTPGGWERDRAARLGAGNKTVQQQDSYSNALISMVIHRCMLYIFYTNVCPYNWTWSLQSHSDNPILGTATWPHACLIEQGTCDF